MSQQRAFDGTRPDVLFERVDAPGPRVALYLDGYAYHATPERNRVAGDADKRTRLRADGLRVFQLTYPDVREWQRRVRDTGYAGAGPADPVWHPYGEQGVAQARAYYSRVRGGLPGELPETVWVNPADLLAGYLRQPDAERWQWRAEAALGRAGEGARARRPAGSGAVGEQIGAALRGGVPQDAAGQAGTVQVLTATDGSGCRLVCAVDSREKPPVWTGGGAARRHHDRPRGRGRPQAALAGVAVLEQPAAVPRPRRRRRRSSSRSRGLDAVEFDALTAAGGGGVLESVRTEVRPDRGAHDASGTPASRPQRSRPPGWRRWT